MDILDNFGVNMGQVKKLGKRRERELGGDGNRTKVINGSLLNTTCIMLASLQIFRSIYFFKNGNSVI